MNGDSQQFTPDPSQADGHWQFRPEGAATPASQAPQQVQMPQQQVPQVPQQQPPMSPAGGPAPSVLVAQPTLPQPAQAGVDINWTASEYVAHSKGTSWYAMLFVGVVGVAIIAYLLTQDVVSTVIIVIIAALVGVSGARKPRVLPYHLSAQGLSIGHKFYLYSQFKSFSIMDEGAFSSIMFLPMQRLMPPLSIYYDPEDEDRIVTALSLYLPMEMRKHDVMDSLARRLRF